MFGSTDDFTQTLLAERMLTESQLQRAQEQSRRNGAAFQKMRRASVAKLAANRAPARREVTFMS